MLQDRAIQEKGLEKLQSFHGTVSLFPLKQLINNHVSMMITICVLSFKSMFLAFLLSSVIWDNFSLSHPIIEEDLHYLTSLYSLRV